MVGMDQSLAPLPLSTVQTVDLEGSSHSQPVSVTLHNPLNNLLHVHIILYYHTLYLNILLSDIHAKQLIVIKIFTSFTWSKWPTATF